MEKTIEGRCHCGAVAFTYHGTPDHITICNCSICRRLRTLNAYGTEENIELRMTPDATIAYVQGDKSLAWHTCRTCGCTTHWASLVDEPPIRIAVNMALAEPAAIAGIRVRHFDGADSWTFLD